MGRYFTLSLEAKYPTFGALKKKDRETRRENCEVMVWYFRWYDSCHWVTVHSSLWI